jgi:hypothetical protein
VEQGGEVHQPLEFRILFVPAEGMMRLGSC